MPTSERNQVESIIEAANNINRGLLILAPKTTELDTDKEMQTHLDEAGDHIEAVIRHVKEFQEIAG